MTLPPSTRSAYTAYWTLKIFGGVLVCAAAYHLGRWWGLAGLLGWFLIRTKLEL